MKNGFLLGTGCSGVGKKGCWGPMIYGEDGEWGRVLAEEEKCSLGEARFVAG